MYALVRNLKTSEVLAREIGTFAVSLVLAEAFFKFRSFSLECLAFLATWTALSGLIDLLGRSFRKGRGPADAV